METPQLTNNLLCCLQDQLQDYVRNVFITSQVDAHALSSDLILSSFWISSTEHKTQIILHTIVLKVQRYRKGHNNLHPIQKVLASNVSNFCFWSLLCCFCPSEESFGQNTNAIFIMYKSTISSRADISVSLLKIGYYFISYLPFVSISNMNSAHVAHFITATVQTRG